LQHLPWLRADFLPMAKVAAFVVGYLAHIRSMFRLADADVG
jgi:hypothetical protein